MKKVKAFLCVGLLACVVAFSGPIAGGHDLMNDPELGQLD